MTRSTRRTMLTSIASAAGLAAGGGVLRAAVPRLRRTPGQILGPFYPMAKPADSDADLTMIKGHRERAQGQVIEIGGRILNISGDPQSGVAIEIWQANSHGRYTHPSDHNPAPLDPNFDGYARLVSDSEGRYRFKTIKPSGYPAGLIQRPAHIHFDVSGKANRLVTQMYFAGDPLNDTDPFLAQAGALKDRLIVTLQSPSGASSNALSADWDIVLEDG